MLQNLDVDYLYEAPLATEKERLADVILDVLKLDKREPDLEDWTALVDALKAPKHEVTIGIVGKYVTLHDAYLSVSEALKHGGISCHAKVDMKWIDSEDINEANLSETFANVDGILVPGGFGRRGTKGMVLASKYARENRIPYLGICLGMQMAIVDFARNVLNLKDADSAEFNPDTLNPVIHLMPDQEGVVNRGGTLRLGAYPCHLSKDSKSYILYGKEDISERHRHRYEVYNDYRDKLAAGGMMIVGKSPDDKIVEMIELSDHPYFIGTQAHPEFKSRPNKAHPLFKGLIKAAIDGQNQ